MTSARVARFGTALVVLALLSGCSASDPEPGAAPLPPVATEAPEPPAEPEVDPSAGPEVEPPAQPEVEPPVEPEVEAPAATAGQQNSSTVTTRVQLSGGALGGPPPQIAAPTTQEVADALYEGGLKFSNGVRHAPDYVYCEQSAQSTSSFGCYTEVRDVAPYWISVEASAGQLTFDFYDWAAG